MWTQIGQNEESEWLRDDGAASAGTARCARSDRRAAARRGRLYEANRPRAQSWDQLAAAGADARTADRSGRHTVHTRPGDRRYRRRARFAAVAAADRAGGRARAERRSAAGASMSARLGHLITMFGTAVGSFLNVCIHRLPLRKSLVWPASHCPHLRRARQAVRQRSDRELSLAARPLPQLPRADFDSIPDRRAHHRRAVPGRVAPVRFTRCSFSGCCLRAR